MVNISTQLLMEEGKYTLFGNGPSKPNNTASEKSVSSLKKQFPMIRDREEVLREIQNHPEFRMTFYSWEEKHRQEFLDICSGVKGVKLLYDSYFKAIMNPDTVPERLEEVLSLLLGKKVKILSVLPNDGARIAAENSLLVLDIVVQLEDGSIANVEVQKIGYAFPGERASCYSADLLLRQYKRVRGQKGKKFQYKDIKKVYTIVFLEKSSGEFHQISQSYLHHGKTIFNTGLHLNLLQEYIFIALDILEKRQQNEDIMSVSKGEQAKPVYPERRMTTMNEVHDVIANNRLEAWLTFLSTDEPEKILKLIERYPEFKPLYEEVYEMCRNMEQMMGFFSKELIELDKNTVQYMVDEMQDTIDKQKEQLSVKDNQISDQLRQLEAKDNLLCDKDNEIETLKRELEELKAKKDIKQE